MTARPLTYFDCYITWTQITQGALRYRANMLQRWRDHLFLPCLLSITFFSTFIAGQDFVDPSFDACKTRIDKILNGSEPWHGISNETIGQYVYDGPVRGMNLDYERMWRKNFTTLTTQGTLYRLNSSRRRI